MAIVVKGDVGDAGLLRLVVDGGRLATITSDLPPSERGIQVSTVYVRPDGRLLEQRAAQFAERGLALPVAGVYGLADAGRVLAEVVAGRADGGVVLDPRR